MKTILTLLILTISGCATTPVVVPIPLPPETIYPVLTDAEITLLNDRVPHETRDKIGTKIKLMREEINQLRDMIQRHNSATLE